MKRWVGVVICMMLTAALCRAEGMKLGAHGAYTLGGDVEDEEFGMGAQLVFGVTEGFSLEAAGTWIQDELGAGVDFDIFVIALSARFGGEIGENVSVYAGGGANYNMFEIEGASDPDDELGFHACAGLELGLSDNLELFAEYRYTWVEYTVESDGGDVDFNRIDRDFDYEYGLARAGINILF
jgi:opacity protein-like surface antigen